MGPDISIVWDPRAGEYYSITDRRVILGALPEPGRTYLSLPFQWGTRIYVCVTRYRPAGEPILGAPKYDKTARMSGATLHLRDR